MFYLEVKWNPVNKEVDVQEWDTNRRSVRDAQEVDNSSFYSARCRLIMCGKLVRRAGKIDQMCIRTTLLRISGKKSVMPVLFALPVTAREIASTPQSQFERKRLDLLSLCIGLQLRINKKTLQIWTTENLRHPTIFKVVLKLKFRTLRGRPESRKLLSTKWAKRDIRAPSITSIMSWFRMSQLRQRDNQDLSLDRPEP